MPPILETGETSNMYTLIETCQEILELMLINDKHCSEVSRVIGLCQQVKESDQIKQRTSILEQYFDLAQKNFYESKDSVTQHFESLMYS